MNRTRLLTVGAAALTLVVGGGVVAGGMQDAPPQDATPAADPVAEEIRRQLNEEPAPAADPAPANPIAIVPPAPAVETAALGDDAPAETDEEQATEADEEEGESEEEKAERLAPETPTPRQRRRVAIVEAIDKITAESMRFEVEVGGRPVRFNESLIFTARACEIAAENELVADSVAYLEVTLQPRGTVRAEPRQIFRGWMFASTPALSGLQHPIYDAWVVGCKE